MIREIGRGTMYRLTPRLGWGPFVVLLDDGHYACSCEDGRAECGHKEMVEAARQANDVTYGLPAPRGEVRPPSGNRRQSELGVAVLRLEKAVEDLTGIVARFERTSP